MTSWILKPHTSNKIFLLHIRQPKTWQPICARCFKCANWQHLTSQSIYLIAILLGMMVALLSLRVQDPGFTFLSIQAWLCVTNSPRVVLGNGTIRALVMGKGPMMEYKFVWSNSYIKNNWINMGFYSKMPNMLFHSFRSSMNLGHATYENAQFHVDYIFIEIKVGEVNRTHGSNYCKF